MFCEAEEAKDQTQRLSVTPALLIKMYSSLQSNPYDFENMILATSLVCFFGFICSGEITIPSQSAYDPSVHLNFADVSVDNLTNPSNSHLFRHGVNTYLGSTVTALFVSKRKHPGLLFHFSDQLPLTKNKFISTFSGKSWSL